MFFLILMLDENVRSFSRCFFSGTPKCVRSSSSQMWTFANNASVIASILDPQASFMIYLLRQKPIEMSKIFSKGRWIQLSCKTERMFNLFKKVRDWGPRAVGDQLSYCHIVRTLVNTKRKSKNRLSRWHLLGANGLSRCYGLLAVSVLLL